MLNGAALVPHKLANRLIELDENGARVVFDTWDLTTRVRGTAATSGRALAFAPPSLAEETARRQNGG